MDVYVIQQIVNALSAGSLYALMAVGLALIFGILRLINFAHGDVMMVAAYLAAFSLFAGLPLPVALVTMVAGTVLIGLAMERIAYRPIRGGPEVAMLLTSFAVGQILQNGTLLLTRLANQPIQIAFPTPDILEGVVAIGTVTIPRVNVIGFGSGVIILAGVMLFLTRTRTGLSMHAAADDLSAAQLVGIRVNWVVAAAFALSAGLASIAGLLYASQAGQINPFLGFSPVLKAFIAAVIGGFGSIPGAVVGAFALGFLEVIPTALGGIADILPPDAVSPEVHSLLATIFPSALGSYRDAIVFVFLILMLLFRPNGILGGSAREDTP